MPPLVCPSPNLIDQGFPRDIEELRIISRALQRLMEGLVEGEFSLVLTAPLRQFIRDCDTNFDWTKVNQCKELLTIYHALAQLGLQTVGVEVLDLSLITTYTPHPVPEGTVQCASAQAWSEEIGRLRSVHDACISTGEPPFAAVGCTSAFAGENLGCYENPANAPCLTLIGPDGIKNLSDSDEWDVAADCARWDVTFDDAKKNISLLGGRVDSPSGSSHYQVKFKDARTWPLDRNHKQIPERYLKQLVPITNLPIEVIKFTLCTGQRAGMRKKLTKYLA